MEPVKVFHNLYRWGCENRVTSWDILSRKAAV